MVEHHAWTVTELSATALARSAAGRADLVVRIGVATAGDGMAADSFDPATGLITVAADPAGLSGAGGASVTVESLRGRLAAPLLAGTVLVSAARAAHSRWITRVPPGTSAQVVSTAWQLDKTRALALQIQRRPQDRLFFRAIANRQLMAMRGSTAAMWMALAEYLPQARRGILPTWLAPHLSALAEPVVGHDVIVAAEELWDRALECDDNPDPLLELAQQWIDLWSRPTPVCGDGVVGLDAPGVPELLDDVVAAALSEADAVAIELGGGDPDPDGALRDRCDEQAGVGFGPSAGNAIAYRRFTGDEQSQRDEAVRRLRRAKFRARSRGRVPVSYPTGRARGNAMMQRAAQRAQGVAVTAKPWQKMRWQPVFNPPIVAGIVVDLSGSMQSWLPAAGAALWTLAAAVRELGGRAAGAGFAGSVHPLLLPATAPSKVPVLSVQGGSDGCADAIGAVTSVADLDGPEAAVLVVLTDGDLPGEDRAPIEAHIDYLRRHGTEVVWALTGSGHQPVIPPQASAVIDDVTPAAFPELVADAIVEVLNAAHAARR